MDINAAAEVSASDLFDQFIEASTMRNILSIHQRILNHADLEPCEFNEFFPKLKRAILISKQRKNWKAKALFSKIDKKAAQKCYSNTKALANFIARADDNQQVDNIDDCASSMQSTARQINTNNNALQSYNCLVIGSGPAGLRTAIELQLLGANKVAIVEKRSRFSRNNVLHLWPFVIDDLKSLGAKKFYGKFCAGSIDHISIRQLQIMLLKVCLMIGCDFRDSCSYLSLCPANIKTTYFPTTVVNNNNSNSSDISGSCHASDNNSTKEGLNNDKCELYKSNTLEFSRVSECSIGENQTIQNGTKQHNDTKELDVSSSHTTQGATSQISAVTDICRKLNESRPLKLHGVHAHFECESTLNESQLHDIEWDFIIGADGRRNTLSNFFPRKEFRGRLAIAITANFINRQTTTETSVPEISGLSFIYNQDMFNALAFDTNIQLENICYYKDDTHYFVMTAKKKSLLERGVLISDFATTQDLLSDSNINRDALLKYAKDAAYWTTGLEPLDFALNHYGQEDCAMFDFTSMYAASNACKAIRTQKNGLALVGLVGDSLLEPFWPTGSGCARGFLSSLDAAWMCRQWAVNRCAIIDHHSTISSRSSKARSSIASHRDEPTTYNRMALSVMAERESIYRILAQTTSENLQQNYSHWTLNPHTRYPNLNRHLVLPSQVEHLITDNDSKRNNTIENTAANSRENGRRIKSPVRKSPKKLKSADASPLTEPKNSKNRSKSLYRQPFKSKSRHDLNLDDDTYFKFEESYKNLVDVERNGMTQYLNHRRPDSESFDDLFKPSLSGTLPSSNNLLNLEAGRARDIDECLRQRRQKTKINFVRHQLTSQLRGDSVDRDGLSLKNSIGGNVALFNELKRLREQRIRGSSVVRPDSKPRECGPLTLLASMRRCASFAERVKSFESKLSTTSEPHSGQQSTVSTPRTPIDNVKNLPQFATLQELFINNSTPLNNENVKKSKIPVTKLTKDDWNVKCWEKRLANAKSPRNHGLEATSRFIGGSMKNLSKATSVDSYHHHSHLPTPKKQVEIFQDRIKEMAEKLKISKETNKFLYADNQENVKQSVVKNNQESGNNMREPTSNGIRSQGWINHLKRELVKGVEAKSSPTRQPMNPVVPNKPIKKLFEDDEDEDDGIDVNKHYDHLCVNRPTNKYLSKGAYTSHLTRTRYDKTNSRVINRPRISASESKQMYLAAVNANTAASQQTSRGSSSSSTRSDYSTNTGNSSSLSSTGLATATKQDGVCSSSSVIDVECCRCKRFVSKTERILIGDSTLHRNCLTCGNCGISLRSNEIQYYLNSLERNPNSIVFRLPKPTNKQRVGGGVATNASDKHETKCLNFVCAICEPSIRMTLNSQTDDRLVGVKLPSATSFKSNTSDSVDSSKFGALSRLESRERFFNKRVDYNELYKNILTPAFNDDTLDPSGLKATSPQSQDNDCHRAQQQYNNHPTDNQLKKLDVQKLKVIRSGDDDDSNIDDDEPSQADADLFSINAQRLAVTPSPIQITLPLKIVSDEYCAVQSEIDVDDPGSSAIITNTAQAATAGYRIARSETIDGSEQVTLVLPNSDETTTHHRPGSSIKSEFFANENQQQEKGQPNRREMIDEEELQRILHLAPTRSSEPKSYYNNNDDDDDDDDESSSDSCHQHHLATTKLDDGAESDCEENSFGRRQGLRPKTDDLSDDGSSSLASPPSEQYGDENSDDDDDGDGNEGEQNSTYDDLVTSEEFGTASDRPDEDDDNHDDDNRKDQAAQEEEEERKNDDECDELQTSNNNNSGGAGKLESVSRVGRQAAATAAGKVFN